MSDSPAIDSLVSGITPENRHDETVVSFVPREVGGGYRFDPDQILEEAKGRGFVNVLIVGELEDGRLWVSSAANAGEAMILMEKAKRQICFGED